jgi:hypothetical protein
MTTNELKRGARVILYDNTRATMADNRKGNTRTITVDGVNGAETGSVYASEIVATIGADGREVDVRPVPT